MVLSRRAAHELSDYRGPTDPRDDAGPDPGQSQHLEGNLPARGQNKIGPQGPRSAACGSCKLDDDSTSTLGRGGRNVIDGLSTREEQWRVERVHADWFPAGVEPLLQSIAGV